MQVVFPRSFYERNTLMVARDLLGACLVRTINGSRLAGIITETEGYVGEEDLACHAKAGKTPRTQVMYGPGGHAYIYFTYGTHWMLNVVTGPVDSPAAVLIRAMWPMEGLAQMEQNRPRPALGRIEKPLPAGWTDGPAKLCQALSITGRLNGIDLCDAKSVLRIEKGIAIPDEDVITGPRVGIDSVPEPWKSKPWRFRVMKEIRNHEGHKEH